MFTLRDATIHAAIAIGFGAAIVATPIPINVAALVLWAVVVSRWAKSQAPTTDPLSGTRVIATQFVSMIVVVSAAAVAPVKTVEQRKAQYIELPQQVMSIAEMESPAAHGLPGFYSFRAPEQFAGEVVRFPSRELTVGQFITAIEAQTPLRHRFGHCGNGWDDPLGRRLLLRAAI